MKYIIYCRKSSEGDRKQMQSLETQLSLLDEYAKRAGLTVVDTLQESRSAKNANHRPLFNSMIDRIKKGEINGILVAHIDRLSRNGFESALIAKLIEEGQLKEIRTPQKIFSSVQDLLYMGIDFVLATHFSRMLSVRVKEGIQTKLKKGEFPNRAPVGYFNKEGKIYPDPAKALYVKKAYELYVTGNYSFNQVCDVLFEQGFRSANGTRMRKSSMERILKNPVYAGDILCVGKIYKGIHSPIISRELFDQVQTVKLNNSKPNPSKHKFLYRGFVRCAVCGCQFTATLKKDKYAYYYCTNGKYICDQHKDYMRDFQVQEVAQSIFDDLSEIVDSEIATLSLEAYCDSLKKNSKYLEQSQQSIAVQIKKNKEKQNKLLDLLLEERITQEIYDQKLKRLEIEKKQLSKQNNNVKNVDLDTTLELLKNFKNEAVSLSIMFSEGDEEIKKDLLDSALWNFSIKDKKLASIRPKILYQKLLNMPKSANLADWRGVGDSNP